MPPTICDGRTLVNGKAKPVALVATAVTRNTAVHAGRGGPRIRAIMTTTPAARAIRLSQVWKPTSVVGSNMLISLLRRSDSAHARAVPWSENHAVHERRRQFGGSKRRPSRAFNPAHERW